MQPSNRTPFDSLLENLNTDDFSIYKKWVQTLQEDMKRIAIAEDHERLADPHVD